jgi:D-psicose/D-tagatose/L-ribulose 3-epimerase
MKFGAHAYMFTDRWSDGSLDILDTARRLGLDCFEIPVGDDVAFTPALTRRRARALGLELTVGPGGRWPVECDLSAAEPTGRQAGLAWHKKQVDLAGALGAGAYCGCLYGHTGVVKPHPPLPEEYERIAEGLYLLAAYGQQRGVAIVLEPMSHFRTHLVNRPEQAVELIGLAGHPNLHVLLDTYHMVVDVRDYAGAFRAAGERLWGMHACENDRGVPGGGLVPWQEIFQALKTMAFDGYVMMETYNSAIPGFAWQRGLFHDVCPDPQAYIRQGLRFLKQGLLGDAQTPPRPGALG